MKNSRNLGKTSALVAAFGALFSMACGDELYADKEIKELSIDVSVADHPVLTAGLVEASCQAWPGFTCNVGSKNGADVRYVVNTDPCVRNEQHRKIKAYAANFKGEDWGTITINAACLVDDESWDEGDELTDYQMTELQGSLAHEVGHLIGLSHVSRYCDGTDRFAPMFGDDNGAICGPAIMSPVVNLLVAATDMDMRAFAVRDPHGLWPKTADDPKVEWYPQPTPETAVSGLRPLALNVAPATDETHILCEITSE